MQMGAESAKSVTRFVVAVLVTAFIAASCNSNEVPGPGSVAQDDSAFKRSRLQTLLQKGPVLNWKYQFGDSISFWSNSVHCQSDCGSWTPNGAEILVKFRRLAQAVGVTGEGAFRCDGTLPVVRAYNLLGQVVGTTTMRITDPSDCGDDNMSGDLWADLTLTDSVIFYLKISPPAPWNWEVAIPGGTIPGRAIIDYEARIVLPQPPAPVPDSICPPTGDVFWDSLGVRRKLDSLFHRSGAMEFPDTARREWMALIYRNPDGSLNIVEPTYSIQNHCRMLFNWPPAFPLNHLEPTLVALIHVHPVRKGEVSDCGGGPVPHDNDILWGFSTTDGISFALTSKFRRDAGLPALAQYVMDGDKIWTEKAFGFPNQPRSNAWNRRPNACRWF